MFYLSTISQTQLKINHGLLISSLMDPILMLVMETLIMLELEYNGSMDYNPSWEQLEINNH
jgi:hypothetical protein